MMLANPYTPGAGFQPAYLAGRDHLLEDAYRYLSSVQKRYPQQSIIYYGLRGVGKTVLLTTVEEAADNLNILYDHIEADEDGKFTSRLIGTLNKYTRSISLKESARDIAKKCAAMIKSFMITYNIEDKSIEIGVHQETSFSTGIYDVDLTDMFVTLGKAALKSEDTICLFVDEIQYLSEKEISGLVTALHRCNQLRLPIMLFGAGLPKILRVVGEARSYAERLFKFQEIDSLSREDAREAIINPAMDFDVRYEDASVDFIIDITGGYPYFIQEFCSIIWIQQKEGDNLIRIESVKSANPLFIKTLDDGFFAVRYNRCTNREKAFMTAMVRCGALPCTIANVAKQMRQKVQSISTARAQLIKKGMIYPSGQAEIDFTVPQFDEFIKRVNPELQV